MFLSDIIGFLAAICTTSAFFPQAYKVYKTKRTRDISLGMFWLLVAGTVLWLIYGIIIESFPIIIANIVTLNLAGYILYKKLKYQNREYYQ
ncbi:MAG TPA: hypothetical protein DCY06_05185 [Bacteroidetes bacterium]|nr:hypothetical protein [Bacteroidota bacterium]